MAQNFMCDSNIFQLPFFIIKISGGGGFPFFSFFSSPTSNLLKISKNLVFYLSIHYWLEWVRVAMRKMTTIQSRHRILFLPKREKGKYR